MIRWIRDNPVRVRSAITALVIFAGWFVPGVTGTEEVIVAGVMALLAVFLGWDASNRVVLPRDSRRDADDVAAFEAMRENFSRDERHGK